MEKSRHAMRLRPRESSNSIAVNDTRTVFGDVTNKREKNNKHENEYQSKRITLKETVANIPTIENTTGKSKISKDDTSRAIPPNAGNNPIHCPLSRVVSHNPLGSTDMFQNTHTHIGTKVKGGLKRSEEENNTDLPSRIGKKAKSITGTLGIESATARRSTRTRSIFQPFKSETSEIMTRTEPKEMHETPIITDRIFAVPPEFRLIRASFDGHNFTHGIAHYDAPDRYNPLLCKDYVTDMFQHMFLSESRTRPKRYMHKQEDINSKMRAILVDWLVEVHMKFRLNPGTLYLCINIIDRYCSKVEVQRSKLQLIGVTALLIACKHEEIYPPEVKDCIYITDRAYHRQEVLDMEQSILKELDWRISVPTAFPFLHRFLSLVNASIMATHAANYYLERSLQEHDMLEFRPSIICAASVLLAINNPDTCEGDSNPKSYGMPRILLEYTEFNKETLIHVANIIATKVANEPITASKRKLVAVKRKFEATKYLKVSSEVMLPSVQHILKSSLK